MADSRLSKKTRACATCGAPFAINPKYSAAQIARAKFCSPRCAGKGTERARKPMIELLGGKTRFGMLTFVGEGEALATRRGIFRCDCGVIKHMALHHIKSGKTISCGCEGSRRSASRFTKHGGYQTPEYRSWNAMMQRCYNQNSTSFADYGARGITVDQSWHGDAGFHRFVAYMGPRPIGMTLDRINADGNYEPGNVRWATAKVQQNNRRVSKIIRFNGLEMNAQDWSLHLGMSKNTVCERLRKGWSIERALTEPAHSCGGRVAKARPGSRSRP